eukprot:gene12379-8505_t
MLSFLYPHHHLNKSACAENQNLTAEKKRESERQQNGKTNPVLLVCSRLREKKRGSFISPSLQQIAIRTITVSFYCRTETNQLWIYFALLSLLEESERGLGNTFNFGLYFFVLLQLRFFR